MECPVKVELLINYKQFMQDLGHIYTKKLFTVYLKSYFAKSDKTFVKCGRKQELVKNGETYNKFLAFHCFF